MLNQQAQGHLYDLASLFLKKTIYINHSWFRITSIHPKSLEKWLFKNLLLRCNRIHVLSRFNEKRLIALYPFTKQIVKRISGAPAGGVIAKDQRAIRKNDRSIIRIACVGRIHPRKGQDQILLALLCLPEDMQKQLVINYAGPHIDQRYLKKVHELAKKFLGKVLFTVHATIKN